MLPLLKTRYAFRFFVVCVILVCAYCTYYAGPTFLYTVVGLGGIAASVMIARKYGLISGRRVYDFDLPEDKEPQ